MIKTTPDEEILDQACQLLAALSNPKRLQIMQILVQQERSVTELSAMVQLGQSALSQHLARLREIQIVETHRVAQVIYYSGNSAAVRQILDTLNSLYTDMQPVYRAVE